MEELQLVFGHNLKAFRLARRLSRRQMGEAMGGYGEAYIGAIERGDRNLTFQTAAHLSRLAGADLFELLARPPEWTALARRRLRWRSRIAPERSRTVAPDATGTRMMHMSAHDSARRSIWLLIRS